MDQKTNPEHAGDDARRVFHPMESLDDSRGSRQFCWRKRQLKIRPVQTNSAESPDLFLGLFAYLLALSETEAKPEDEDARAGDLRRRAGGGFWIFDGEAWVEW